MVAVDAIGAGVGELVFWCRGKEASFPFKREDTPTDCTIVGIVDSEQHVTKMILARVVGNIVATQKNRRYENARVMLCQQITPEGEETSYSGVSARFGGCGCWRHGFDRAGRLERIDGGDGRSRACDRFSDCRRSGSDRSVMRRWKIRQE